MSDDWTLTPSQLAWMESHHIKIMFAYRFDGLAFNVRIDELKADGFRDVFRAMGWDEAYDRYETMTAGPGDG